MGVIVRFLKGLGIGAATFAPGVSGGTMAIMFGLYDQIMDAIGNFYVDFKKKFVYMFPVAVGGLIGFILFNYAVSYMLENYELQVMSLFVGMIVGSVPFVYKSANKQGFKLRYLLFFVAAAVLSVFLLSSLGGEHTAVEASAATDTGNTLGWFTIAIYGAIIGCGAVMPGMSASAILLQLGAYYTFTSAVRDMNISVLIPLAIGALVGIVIFAKVTNILLKKFYGYTYYAILGLVAGSVILIFPPLGFDIMSLICVVIMLVGFVLSYMLGRMQKE